MRSHNGKFERLHIWGIGFIPSSFGNTYKDIFIVCTLYTLHYKPYTIHIQVDICIFWYRFCNSIRAAGFVWIKQNRLILYSNNKYCKCVYVSHGSVTASLSIKLQHLMNARKQLSTKGISRYSHWDRLLTGWSYCNTQTMLLHRW